MTEPYSENPRWKVLARRWRLFVGVGLLATLFFVVGPGELLGVFRRASPLGVAAVCTLLAVWLLLGALNVWILLRSLADVPLGLFVRVYSVSWATSLLLPGQLGDATQVLFLRRYGVPMSTSGAAYLVDKVLSLGWMLLVAAAGVGLFASFPWTWIVGLVGVGSLGLVALWTVWRSFVARSEGRLREVDERIRRLGSRIAIFRRHPIAVLLNVSNTVLKWVVLAWIYQLAFATFEREIEWIHAATLPIMSSLVGYIPISIGGAGTMEWTAVALFGSVGIPAEDVLGAYLMLRGLLLLGALTVLGVVQLAGSEIPVQPGKESADPNV